METKYIVAMDPVWEFETLFMFPETVEHAGFAAKLGWKVISAGFIKWRHDLQKSYVGGESISLKLSYRKEDQALLDKLLAKADF